MKFYSEKTKKMYDAVEQLEAAELEYDKKHEAELAKQKERKARAEEIDEARKAIIAAEKHYNELLNQFIKDYGSYHATYSDEVTSIRDFFNRFFG